MSGSERRKALKEEGERMGYERPPAPSLADTMRGALGIERLDAKPADEPCPLCGRTRSPIGRPRHHPGCERLATEPNETYSESLVTPPCDVPVGDEQTLWRIRRAGGGVVIEEVTAKDVTVIHQHAHDIYDIAMSRFNAELHRRVAS